MITITYENGDYDRDPKTGELVFKDLVETYKDKKLLAALMEFFNEVQSSNSYSTDKVTLTWVPNQKKQKGKK